MTRIGDAMAAALGITEQVQADRDLTAPLRAEISRLSKALRTAEQDKRAAEKRLERFKAGLPKDARDWLAMVEQLEEEVRDLEMRLEEADDGGAA